MPSPGIGIPPPIAISGAQWSILRRFVPILAPFAVPSALRVPVAVAVAVVSAVTAARFGAVLSISAVGVTVTASGAAKIPVPIPAPILPVFTVTVTVVPRPPAIAISGAVAGAIAISGAVVETGRSASEIAGSRAGKAAGLRVGAVVSAARSAAAVAMIVGCAAGAFLLLGPSALFETTPFFVSRNSFASPAASSAVLLGRLLVEKHVKRGSIRRRGQRFVEVEQIRQQRLQLALGRIGRFFRIDHGTNRKHSSAHALLQPQSVPRHDFAIGQQMPLRGENRKIQVFAADVAENDVIDVGEFDFEFACHPKRIFGNAFAVPRIGSFDEQTFEAANGVTRGGRGIPAIIVDRNGHGARPNFKQMALVLREMDVEALGGPQRSFGDDQFVTRIAADGDEFFDPAKSGRFFFHTRAILGDVAGIGKR